MRKAFTTVVLLSACSVFGQTWIQWPESEGGNGHWYGLTRQAYRGWAQAEAEAQTYLDGHLASINSMAEQKFIEAAFLSGHSVSNTYWIGFNDFANEGDWIWSTGEPTTFTNWRAGEPDNAGFEDGALLNWSFWAGFGDFGTWSDCPENRIAHHGLIEIQGTAAPLLVEVDPPSQTVAPRQTAVFRAWTYGLPGNLRYQWQSGLADIPSATNQILVLTNVLRSQSGVYTVVVSSDAMPKSITQSCMLVVSGPPMILSGPTSRIVTEGDSVEFLVSAEGEGPLSYEWQFNGVPLPGARESRLVLENVKLTQTGHYSVRVSNPDGSVMSTAAKLTALPAGFTLVYGNDFEGQVGPEWSSTTTAVTPSARRQFLGRFGNKTVSLALRGLPPHSELFLSYDIYVIGSWDGNDGPDMFEVKMGGLATLLRTTFCNTDCDWLHANMRQSYPLNYPEGSFLERTGVTEKNTLGYYAADYFLRGDSVYGMQHLLEHSADAVTLTFGGSGLDSSGQESWGLDNVVIAFKSAPLSNAPEIVVPPRSQIIRKGDAASFCVTAEGAPPLRYQWRLGGQNIAGATNRVLTIENVNSAHAGRYSVIVENEYGLISRSPADLVVVTAEPSSQTLDSGGSATFSLGLTGTASVQWRRNGFDLPGETNHSLVIPALGAADAGQYEAIISTDGALYCSAPANLSVVPAGGFGSAIWAARVGAWLNTTPAIGLDGTIYVASNNRLSALDQEGHTKWTLALPLQYASPCVGADGTVFVAGWDQPKVFAVLPNGKLRWEFATVRKNFTATPAIAADGTLYIGEQDVPEGTHRFYAINPDGSTRWVTSVNGRISQAAIGAEGVVYFKTSPPGQGAFVHAVNSEGETRWTCPIRGPSEAPLAIGPDGTIYSGSSAGILYAISKEGQIRWEFRASWTASLDLQQIAVGTDGTIYASTVWSGEVIAVAPDGSLRWSAKYADRAYSAPVVDNAGNVYLSADHQSLVCLRPGGELAWQFWTDSFTWFMHEGRRPQPVLDPGGTLYIGATTRDYSAKLYAIRALAPSIGAWPMPYHDPQHTSRAPLILILATNLNVSAGADVEMRAVTQEHPPVAFQWYHNGNPISNATEQILSLAQVSTNDAGEYYVTMSYINGIAASQAVRLLVDTTFSKVTTGDVVNVPDSLSNTRSGTAWGDYDNDGYLDLFVSVYGNKNLLFHNNRNETFTRVAAGSVASEYAICLGGVWGDYDNDGLLDLFTPNLSENEPKANVLHHNKGTNGFSRLNIWPFVDDIGRSVTAAWGDYDNDGFLDLFVGNSRAGQVNFLYHNRGDGTFGKVLQGSIVNEVVYSACASWADYDNDGDLDLFVGAESGGINRLYRNNGNGTFTKITSGPVAGEGGSSVGCAWGDYDNDGDLDLFVANFAGDRNYLYRNLGNGTFEKVQSGQIVTDASYSVGCCWGDYDNDGFLDLFVANYRGQNNFLYHNNGDGTFTRITSGSIVNDGGNSRGCAWGDYNSDGFLDLFVTSEVGEPNFLYRNSPNLNHWLKLKLIGTSSNRAAIGAKVRVGAAIRGRTVWQLREISGGSGYTSQNALEAHFGLGDAREAAVVKIQWPSGIEQEFKNVLADRFLTVTEPPVLTALGTSWPGEFELVLTSRGGFSYQIERSADLQTWMPISRFYEVSGSVQVVDSEAGLLPFAFYRAVEIPKCGPGLASWWAGEGNGSDEQGHLDMQAHGRISYAPGVFGQAFDIDPEGGWLQTTAPAITKLDNWTLDLWVFWRGLDASGNHRVHRPLHIGGLDGYGLIIADRALCGIESWSCGKEGMLAAVYGGITTIPTGFYLRANAWTHLALTRSGGVLRVFANGSEVFSSATADPKPPTGAVCIGHENPLETFDGLVDEPRVWSRALSPEEIREIYRVGALRLSVDRQ